MLFPDKADGSQVERDGKVVGSKLIGQDFTSRCSTERQAEDDGGKPIDADPRYFQPRPSATAYSADVTFFNNLGPNNKELREHVQGATSQAYLALERPYDPGLTPRDVPGRRGDHLGLGRRSAHLAGQRADPGEPHRRGAPAPARRGSAS